MPLDRHSPEFARLTAAWLDGEATAEDADELWQAVAQDPGCAAELAAVARFEHLLSATVLERAGEKEAARGLTKEMAVSASRRRVLPSATALRMAALLAVLALAAWLLWPARPGGALAHSSTPKPVIETHPSSTVSVRLERGPAVASAAGSAQPASALPLDLRLDGFFLPRVALDQVPLQRALGLLQGQLVDLNVLHAEDLAKLRISLPTDAASRRVTFRSGPISFLKAVRAVAALGGCDVTVEEPTLSLVLRREIYPELPNKKDVRDMLAGRFNADGSAAASDPNRVAALLADAASLGIPVPSDRSLESLGQLPITRGQWLALQALTDAREQLGQYALPSFQLYYSGGGATGGNRIINEEETPGLKAQLAASGTQPPVVLKPSAVDLMNFGSSSPYPGISIQPAGEGFQITIAQNDLPAGLPSEAAAPPVQATYTANTAGDGGLTFLIGRGQGITLSLSDIGVSSAFGRADTITIVPTDPNPSQP